MLQSQLSALAAQACIAMLVIWLTTAQTAAAKQCIQTLLALQSLQSVLTLVLQGPTRSDIAAAGRRHFAKIGINLRPAYVACRMGQADTHHPLDAAFFPPSLTVKAIKVMPELACVQMQPRPSSTEGALHPDQLACVRSLMAWLDLLATTIRPAALPAREPSSAETQPEAGSSKLAWSSGSKPQLTAGNP